MANALFNINIIQIMNYHCDFVNFWVRLCRRFRPFQLDIGQLSHRQALPETGRKLYARLEQLFARRAGRELENDLKAELKP
jgi:hypothetical protein